MSETIIIQAQEMKAVFQDILQANGFSQDRAEACASIFCANSVDGVLSHGVNRFPRFIEYIQKGYVHPEARPTLKHAFGGIEQWHGNLGPGPLNAVQATERAIALSSQHGIGCVALSHTNHWMRGGYYGWQAAEKGYVLIAWTNTMANMPTWNAQDCRLGNNPLVIGLPYGDAAIVMDMAMSQFSYGVLEGAAMKGETLPVWGGFDTGGDLSKEPAEILKSARPLPIGYWKGAGLSLLLDLLATILSGGLSTHEISQEKDEYQLSQVFIAIDLSKLDSHSVVAATVNRVIEDYQASVPVSPEKKIKYPRQRVMETRKRSLEKGIPVQQEIWDKILKLKE